MDRFQNFAAVTISYVRGDTQIDGISATVGRTPYDVVEGDVMVSHESRDYIVNRADLVDGATQLIPINGDRIIEADGRIYEVSMPKRFNIFESMGPDGKVLKIHTIGKKS
jgi:hypothetical protein